MTLAEQVVVIAFLFVVAGLSVLRLGRHGRPVLTVCLLVGLLVVLDPAVLGQPTERASQPPATTCLDAVRVARADADYGRIVKLCDLDEELRAAYDAIGGGTEGMMIWEACGHDQAIRARPLCQGMDFSQFDRP